MFRFKLVQVTVVCLTKGNYLWYSAAIIIGIVGRDSFTYIIGRNSLLLKQILHGELGSLKKTSKMWTSCMQIFKPLYFKDMWVTLKQMNGQKKRIFGSTS